MACKADPDYKAPVAGKAGKGEGCNSKTDDTGCIEGHQCATYAGTAVTETTPAGERCAASADCSTEGITCGAMQLGASLVAAVAIANFMWIWARQLKKGKTLWFSHSAHI